MTGPQAQGKIGRKAEKIMVMKRFLMILLLALPAVTLSAQRLAWSVEGSASLGMDSMQGCEYTGQLKAVVGMEGLGLKGLTVGIGSGMNYASVLAGRWYSTTDGSETFVYQKEYLVPVFARLKYTFHSLNLAPYILVDGGWAFNVGGQKANGYSLPIKDGDPCGMPLDYEGRAVGLYLQPQIGFSLSDHLYVGLGFMMQAYTQNAVAVTGTLLAKDKNYGSQTFVSKISKENYFNALSLHIGLKF